MKKRVPGRPRGKASNLATCLIPVRVNSKEYKLLWKYMEKTGERYLTQTVRKLIQAAIAVPAP